MQNELVNYKNLLDISQTLAEELFLNTQFPWEVIPEIKEYILKIGPQLPKSEYKEFKPGVWISKYADVFESAYIGAPTIIQANSQIRHCAFIRGAVIVGENVVVGNSTEIKNAILFNNVQVPHFNYIGDSILGYKAHMGAGSIISNVKSDKSNVTVNIKNTKINTYLRKFGAIVGDYVEIGCNAVLNPGTIIGRNTTIYPTSMVRGTIEENKIVKNPFNIVSKY